MHNRRAHINEGIHARVARTDLTVWVRGDEERLQPTRKIRVAANDLSPNGFSFRHADFLRPGTTVLAYLPSSPHAHLVETEVCGCTQDPTDGAYRIDVTVKGRSNRLPLLIVGAQREIPPA